MTRRHFSQLLFGQLCRPQASSQALVDSLSNPLPSELRAPVGVLHHELSRLAENLVIHIVGSANRQPGVAGCGLNVNLSKWCSVENLAVGHAVEGYTAREA